MQVLTVCTWNQRVKVGYISVAGSWISPSSGQGYSSGSRVQGIITYSKRGPIVFGEAFHPSIPSSIHGWHHTGKKTLGEINNPPFAHVSLSRKGMPGPKGGHPQDFDINISNKPNIYMPSPVFSMVSCMLLSHGSQAVQTSRFRGQGPHGYMWNVVYREVLEM